MNKVLKRVFIFFVVIVIGAIVGFSYSYYEARSLKIRKFDFIHKDIPDSFVDKKIIFISDTHCNQYYTPNDVAKLVELVNSMQADIIVLGGDNTNVDTIYSVPYFDEMAKLEAKYGVYSVLGNHDYWEDLQVIKDGIDRCGFNVCDNASYWIHEGKDSIKLGGVGDMWEIEQLVENTIHDVKTNDFCILLSHNPDFIEELDTDKVDIILSGHTHAGQVTLFGLYAPIMPSHWKPNLPNTGQKYRYGWKERNGTHMYVTSGVGMGKFPFRFFAQPEIVQFTLKNK